MITNAKYLETRAVLGPGSGNDHCHGAGGTRAAKLPSAKNDAVRHEVCESLSTQAEAYYTGQYTWDTLSALEGDSSGKSLEGTKSELYKTLQQLMDDTMTYSITYNGSNGLQVYWPLYGYAARI